MITPQLLSVLVILVIPSGSFEHSFYEVKVVGGQQGCLCLCLHLTDFLCYFFVGVLVIGSMWFDADKTPIVPFIHLGLDNGGIPDDNGLPGCLMFLVVLNIVYLFNRPYRGFLFINYRVCLVSPLLYRFPSLLIAASSASSSSESRFYCS